MVIKTHRASQTIEDNFWHPTYGYMVIKHAHITLDGNLLSSPTRLATKNNSLFLRDGLGL